MSESDDESYDFADLEAIAEQDRLDSANNVPLSAADDLPDDIMMGDANPPPESKREEAAAHELTSESSDAAELDVAFKRQFAAEQRADPELQDLWQACAGKRLHKKSVELRLPCIDDFGLLAVLFASVLGWLSTHPQVDYL
jgi:hypothetical protein